MEMYMSIDIAHSWHVYQHWGYTLDGLPLAYFQLALSVVCQILTFCLSAITPLPQQTYGRELSEAYEWIQKFKVSRKEAELHQAWDLYYHVFKRINKQLHSLTTLELQYVAPALVSGGRGRE